MGYLRTKATVVVTHVDGVTKVKAKVSPVIRETVEVEYRLQRMTWGAHIEIPEALKLGIIKEVKDAK